MAGAFLLPAPAMIWQQAGQDRTGAAVKKKEVRAAKKAALRTGGGRNGAGTDGFVSVNI